MKIIHDSAPCLLHLLLLAELFVQSSSRPTSAPPPCGKFRSMIHQVESLMKSCKNLHGLETDDELLNFGSVENKLNNLPHIEHSARYFNSLTVNESLSQLYVHTEAFRLHVDWLKKAKENFGLPSESAKNTSDHLLKLSNLTNESLQQINEEAPRSPPPSFPVVSTAFDVLQFSIEISERLQVFSDWSKRVLRHLQKLSHCPKH